MIIVLKDADFSANNVGKVQLPNTNLNYGEGTSNPLLFKYSTTTGYGEFLGVDFVTKTNPTPFSIVRKLHKGGTGTSLYAFQTGERTTIDFPLGIEKISMAVWINMSNWKATQGRPSGGDNNINLSLQAYSSSWQGVNISSGFAGRWLESEIDDTSNPEKTSTVSGDSYLNYSIKSKVLDRKTVSGEDWICVGTVFSDITPTAAVEEGSRIRVRMQARFMTADQDFEVGNMQVVETNEYLDPDTIY